MENKLEILKVEINDNQEPIVGGRELHEALGIETDYRHWFKRMREYGFVENQDYVRVVQKCPTPGGIQEVTNHALKLDMAKEIAMIQRNEKGKQVRQYFLKVEKEFNSPEKVMARALKIADDKIKMLTIDMEELNKTIEEQKPKVLFADSVCASESSVLIGELAKILKQNGIDIGQNRLFHWLRENGFLIKSGESKNLPTQKGMNLELFEIKERTHFNPDGSSILTRTTKITPKGQIYFINKFLNQCS